MVRADFLWFITSDVFVSRAVVMRSDDDGSGSLSISICFASLMNWSTLVPSNHTWQICARESEVFNKCPGPLIKPLFRIKRRVDVFNNLHTLKAPRTALPTEEKKSVFSGLYKWVKPNRWTHKCLYAHRDTHSPTAAV